MRVRPRPSPPLPRTPTGNSNRPSHPFPTTPFCVTLLAWETRIKARKRPRRHLNPRPNRSPAASAKSLRLPRPNKPITAPDGRFQFKPHSGVVSFAGVGVFSPPAFLRPGPRQCLQSSPRPIPNPAPSPSRAIPGAPRSSFLHPSQHPPPKMR